jgi:predicted ATPase
VPIAHEDDPDRAVRAALDMQSALAQFNEQRLAQDTTARRLQMRIGINTGVVAGAGYISPQSQDFLITGDAVNIAARLQQMGAADTILVGERTYLNTREVFDFRDMAPLQVKGKPTAINAYVVLGLRTHAQIIDQRPRGIPGHLAPLVGRELELTFLHTNYALVQAERRPHLITILGVPGIGKSRLVREFLAREQQAAKSASANGSISAPKVLKGHCPPYGEGITYWPLVEILHSLLAAHTGESSDDLEQRFRRFVVEVLNKARRSESPDEIVSSISRHIGRGLGNVIHNEDLYLEGLKKAPKLSMQHPNVHAEQDRAHVALLRAWRVLLEALAQEQPLIIVIDDLQWADEALLEFLEYLTERITNVPILFLCPSRPDFFERRRDWGGGKRNFTTLQLDALDREESSNLVNALLNNDDLPEVLRTTILTRSEGNPFFVEEIVRMFIDQGILVNEEDQEHHEMRWKIGPHHETLSELTAVGDLPEDSLLNAHYLLPLPRVPDTIQGVLAARVDLLSATEKFVLQNAAIIGRIFWLSSLRELTSNFPDDLVQAALEALAKRDFIVEMEKQARSPVAEDRVFSFQHMLIRDVVYNNIPRTRRAQVHARLALWLEAVTESRRDTFVELLAYHYQQALANWSPGLVPNSLEMSDIYEADKPVHVTKQTLQQKAIQYLTLAGDQAMHSYYTVRAIQAYEDALDLLAETDEPALATCRMYVKLGDAYAQRSSVDEAWQEYRRALRMALEKQLFEASELLALYERLALLTTRWLGRFQVNPDALEIRSYIDSGLELLDKQPMSREHAAFLTYQAFWYIRQLEMAAHVQKAGLAEQALACGRQALDYAEELHDPSLLSLVLDALSFIYRQYHQYNEAHRLQHRRQALADQLTARDELYDLYFSLGYVHESIADYAAALEWFGHAWNYAQTMESPAMLLTCMTGRMRAWRQWNRWHEAQQVARDILRSVEQYQQDEQQQLWALETLAVIAYRTGKQTEGDQYTRQYKRLIEQQAESRGAETQKYLASRMHAMHLAREEWDLATADYQEKLRSSEPLPSPEVVSTLADLLVKTGANAEEQAVMCERAITLSEASGAQKSLLVSLRARGRMATEQQAWQQAEADLRRSLQLCVDLDLPWERGHTLYALGMLYQQRAHSYHESDEQQRNADLGRARDQFEQAQGFFASLNAASSVQRVQVMLTQESIARV